MVIKGNEIRFSFRGKKGVNQNLSLKSKKLARIIGQCRDITGQELFQYYDGAGLRRSVDSGMVNNYIKAIFGKNCTAKDFRTWVGTNCAFEAFMELGCCDDIAENKKKIVQALDMVAKRLGNTRTVCRKYYVHPAIIDHYSDNTIGKYFEQISKCDGDDMLDPKEQVLMNILETVDKALITS